MQEVAGPAQMKAPRAEWNAVLSFCYRGKIEVRPPALLQQMTDEIVDMNQTLAGYFSRFPWYRPNTWEVTLNAVEQANVTLIQSMER
jgi:hypothetical protein